MISQPVTAFHLLAVDFRTAMPPPTENFNDCNLVFLNFELVNNKLKRVFTAVITVNLFLERVLTKDFRSLGFATNIFFEPIL